MTKYQQASCCSTLSKVLDESNGMMFVFVSFTGLSFTQSYLHLSFYLGASNMLPHIGR